MKLHVKDHVPFAKKAKRFLVKWTIIIGLPLMCGVYAGGFLQADELEAFVPEAPKTIDLTPEKIDALKDKLVADLTDCENAGYTQDDGLVKIDNNGKGTLRGDAILSYGELQYKTSTMQRHYKWMTGEDITPLKAKLTMLDTPAAQKVAKYAIFEHAAIDEWRNCAVKHDLFARVAAIKSLEN